MSFARYPAYKDSGVEWLGEVPGHWEVKSIKWISPVQRGASPRPIDDPKYFDDQGEYAWVRIADVSASDGELRETTQRLSDLGSSLSVKIEPGELFISIAGTVGKPCITRMKACIHDGFVYFPKLKLNPQFFFRIFEAGTCYGGLGKFGTQLNLNTDTIGSIRIAVPPPDELANLLTFLDIETAKIDGLMAEQRALVALLKEKRQAVISHAVTKGLNPAVPMKDTGVAWLGEVPGHWEVKRLKYNLQLLTEKTNRRDHAIALENIESWTGRYLPTETEFEGEGVAFEAGDILFGKLRPYLAKAYLTESSGEAVGDFHVLRPTVNTHSRFAQYQILNREFIDLVDGSTFGSKMPRASWEFVAGIALASPPKAEQQAIATFLDAETAKIDTLTQEAQTAIALLQERRTALISAAVTGKMDVRAAVAA